MRLFEKLAIGSDGRNRAMLSPFAVPDIAEPTLAGQGGIRPVVLGAVTHSPGAGAGVGVCRLEFSRVGDGRGIVWRCHHDGDLRRGDPYMKFAELAGAVPPGATKSHYPEIRGAFKVCMLAVQYGQSDFGLAHRLNVPTVKAKDLLDLHQLIYHKFWHWSERCVDHAMLAGYLDTRFGWRLHTGDDMRANPRSLMNFCVQANGAEMMRLAAMRPYRVGARTVRNCA